MWGFRLSYPIWPGTGRVRFEAATDNAVMEAMDLTMRKEGIIPALESAHAFARAFVEAPQAFQGRYHHHQPVGPGGQRYFYHCRRV